MVAVSAPCYVFTYKGFYLTHSRTASATQPTLQLTPTLLLLCSPLPARSFLIFLAIYSGIVNNTSLSRYVRYHAMQAVLLDVLLM